MSGDFAPAGVCTKTPIVVCLLMLSMVYFADGTARITTVQLGPDGAQYFVSSRSPYAPLLNYHLAYGFCRSIGLQLVALESREEADVLSQYLADMGFAGLDFWTSGNRLGSEMMLWLSSGAPFNTTFDYLRQEKRGDCVALSGPADFAWAAEDCSVQKHFICEQMRCYYYNYGTDPVTPATHGRPTFTSTTTTEKVAKTDGPYESNQQPGSVVEMLNDAAAYEHSEDSPVSTINP